MFNHIANIRQERAQAGGRAAGGAALDDMAGRCVQLSAMLEESAGMVDALTAAVNSQSDQLEAVHHLLAVIDQVGFNGVPVFTISEDLHPDLTQAIRHAFMTVHAELRGGEAPPPFILHELVTH